MKRTVAFILFMAVLLTAFPAAFSTSATSGSSGGKIYPLIPQAEECYSGAAEKIIEGLRDHESVIDVKKYKIHKDDIMEVYKSAVFTAPDVFFVDASSINYQFDPETDAVATISPVYIFPRGQLKSYEKKFENAVDNLLDNIDKNWPDYKKALIIHDRLIARSQYKKVNLRSYTSYSVLVNKFGNCEGYSRAYSFLLSRVGIKTKCINSSSAAHLWNYVKIGGKWYHVDVTSDDQVPDTNGFISHKFFLISDAKLQSYDLKIHKGYKNDISYSSDYECTSDKYDNAFFRNINSQIISRGESFYFIKDFYNNSYAALIKRKGSTNKVLCNVNSRWYHPSGDVYVQNYSRLCEYKNFIFFNSPACIYRYNINTGKVKKVFEKPSFWYNDFYGVRTDGSYIRVSLKKGISEDGSDRAVLKVNGSKVLKLPFLRYSSIKLKVNSKFDLKVYYGSGKVKFSSSSVKTAKVNSKGRITALKKGTATIKVVKNNRTMKCKVKVI